MKKSFAYLIFSFVLIFFAKANTTDTTKLIIIGTRHDGNAYIKPDSFLQIFRSFNPDIILEEFDSSSIKDCRLVERKGVEIAIKFKVYERSIESESVLIYQKENTAVCIKDYDIFIANRFQYVKDLGKLKVDFAAALDTLYHSHFVKKKDKKIIEKYWDLFRNIIDPIMEKGLYFFNQPIFNDAFSKSHYLKQHELLSFFKKYPSLQSVEKKYRADIEFWEKRNTTMVKNILSVIQSNPSKKIIVLCGAAHKYFLLDKLLPLQTKNSFVIKEFWE